MWNDSSFVSICLISVILLVHLSLLSIRLCRLAKIGFSWGVDFPTSLADTLRSNFLQLFSSLTSSDPLSSLLNGLHTLKYPLSTDPEMLKSIKQSFKSIDRLDNGENGNGVVLSLHFLGYMKIPWRIGTKTKSTSLVTIEDDSDDESFHQAVYNLLSKNMNELIPSDISCFFSG
jgi:hypothetical protein